MPVPPLLELEQGGHYVLSGSNSVAGGFDSQFQDESVRGANFLIAVLRCLNKSAEIGIFGSDSFLFEVLVAGGPTDYDMLEDLRSYQAMPPDARARLMILEQ